MNREPRPLPTPAPTLRISEPVLSPEDINAVSATMSAGWISGYGPSVQQFEDDFSAFCGVRHGVATTSGATALHLALAAAGVKPGDEVIIPGFTMLSVLFAVAQTGATAVLCDSDSATWNIDCAAVEAALSPRTRAIIAVHTYGLPCDMGKLRAVSADRGITLIEDAAEAHGAELNGARAGSLGDVACFSFFANKIITSGEGGMVVTNDPDLAARARSLADLARTGERAYEHHGIGFNYRLSSLQAALGLSQLQRIDEFVARRRRNARRYEQLLGSIPGITLRGHRQGYVGSDWMTGILVDEGFGETAAELAARLAASGVETRPFFQPVHLQPFWEGGGEFPVASHLASVGLLLPSGNELRDEDTDYVCQVILGGRKD